MAEIAEIKVLTLFVGPLKLLAIDQRYTYYRALGYRLKRKLKTGLVLAFIAGLLVLFAYPSYRQGEPSLRGRPAKDFQLTLDGKPGRLTDLRGKVIVLNFWATWCQPCIDEAPSLNRLQKQIAPQDGVVLGISEDDDQSAYDNFLKAFGVDFPTYRDPSKHQIALDYGTSMYPETYIIDPKGRIDRKVIGAQDWTSLEMIAYLHSLQNEK
jgi:cytochrome c biogenesis protein CcmG/thiol:disulfide interchange protein DsbE